MFELETKIRRRGRVLFIYERGTWLLFSKDTTSQWF